jgi:tetratricopeptide (TPR) repeat protein
VFKRLLICLLFAPCLLHADNTEKIRARIGNTSHDTSGVRYLLQLSDSLSISNGDLSLEAVETACRLAAETNDRKFIAESFYTLGVRLMNQGEYVDASQYLFRANGICDSIANETLKLKALNSIGNLYSHQDQVATALDYYEQALTIAQKLKIRKYEGIILNNLGNCYYLKSQSDTALLRIALQYYNQAYSFSLNDPDETRRITAMNNLVLIHTDLKEYQKATELCDTIRALCIAIGDSNDLAYAYNNMGRIAELEKKHQLSLDYYWKSYAICKSMNNRDLMAETLRGIAEAYYAVEEYELAWKYHNQYSNLFDSLVNSSNKEIISELQNRIETNRQDREITNLKQKKELADLRNTRQNLFLYLTIIAFLMIALFAFLLYKRSKAKGNANQLLNAQNEIIEQKNKDITDSINYAKRIQDAVLGRPVFQGDSIPENFIISRPKEIVSGDFYWSASSGSLFFAAVCDCTGQGVPGGFMSLLHISLLNEAVNEKKILSPEKILSYCRIRLNETLTTKKNLYQMNAMLVCYDKHSGKLTYSANGNAPLLAGANSIEFLNMDKANAESELYSIDTISEGMLYLTTGLIQGLFPEKTDNLKKQLYKIAKFPMEAQRDELNRFFNESPDWQLQSEDIIIAGLLIHSKKTSRNVSK